MNYILLLIVLYIIFDHYYRSRKISGFVDYLRISQQMTNRVLLSKSVITPEELKAAQNEIRENTSADEWRNGERV